MKWKENRLSLHEIYSLNTELLYSWCQKKSGISIQDPYVCEVVHIESSFFCGAIVECTFDIKAYSPDYFKKLGIDLPKHISESGTKRQAEYLAGRFTVLEAFKLLNINARPPLPGKQRQPLWISPVVGSISHHDSKAICAAKLSKTVGGVGIDIEKYIKPNIANNIVDNVVKTSEVKLLESIPLIFSHALTIAFSAKESLFKALFPLVHKYFCFTDVSIVEIDIEACHIRVMLEKKLTQNIVAGQYFDIYFLLRENDIITFIDIKTN